MWNFKGRDIELVSVKNSFGYHREPYCPGLNKRKCLFVIRKTYTSLSHTHTHTHTSVDLPRMKGSKTCYPKICHFGMWIILSWRQSRPRDSGKTFTSPLTILKNLDRELYQKKKKRLLPEITFLSERHICMAWQISNYQTSAHLIVLWIVLPPPLLEAPDLYPIS